MTDDTQVTLDYVPKPVATQISTIENEKKESSIEILPASTDELDGHGRSPTEEEIKTLRLVSAPMHWAAILMCTVELAERASYYGSTGPFSNFIQRGLPKGGSGTGAVAHGAAGLKQTPGALNLGLQVATAVTTSFNFLAYTIPILGGIIADTIWGRYFTICVGTAVGAIAHILLIVPSIPSVISGGHAIGPFILSVLILAFAAGFIKPSLAPLLMDQSPVQRRYVKELPSGELVIVDPETTIQRYLLVFYWCINIGAFFSLATSYAERYVGFWLSFLIPGIFYMLVPIALWMAHKHLKQMPLSGSVVKEAFQVFGTVLSSGGWKKIFIRTKSVDGLSAWDSARPSIMRASGTLTAKKEATLSKARFWDDEFVDELKRTISACQIFLFIPIFAIADGGIGSVQNSQAATLVGKGVPNDLISKFNALTIVVFAPILNYGFYPLMRHWGIDISPVRRLSIGFFLGALAMTCGAIIQWRVYVTSPCGYYATKCSDISNVSLWAQIPLYSLPAIGELFINVTSYEIAYTRAPARMKGLVYAMVLFASALSSAVVLIVNASGVLVDPHLIWPFVAMAAFCLLSIVCMEVFFQDLNVKVDQVVGRMESENEKPAQSL